MLPRHIRPCTGKPRLRIRLRGLQSYIYMLCVYGRFTGVLASRYYFHVQQRSIHKQSDGGSKRIQAKKVCWFLRATKYCVKFVHIHTVAMLVMYLLSPSCSTELYHFWFVDAINFIRTSSYTSRSRISLREFTVDTWEMWATHVSQREREKKKLVAIQKMQSNRW